MKEGTLKLKKGGMDTIVAYIVVMLPLLYVVVYMVATIYHFSVQTYMNQVVKEATMMASAHGTITDKHREYIQTKLADVLKADNPENTCTIKYYIKKFDPSQGVVSANFLDVDGKSTFTLEGDPRIEKTDIIGIYVESTKVSILDRVTSFNFFGGNSGETGLKYSAYKEEIVRNANPNQTP